MKRRDAFRAAGEWTAPRRTAPLLLAALCVLMRLSAPLSRHFSYEGISFYIAAAILQITLLLLPALIFSRLVVRGANDDTDMTAGRGLPLARKLLCSLILLLCMLLIAASYFGTAVYLSEGGTVTTLFEQLDLSDRPPSHVLGALLAFAILPALCEEYLCRGVLYGLYEEYGQKSALLFSSLAFAMLHLSLQKFPFFLLFGCLLGMLRILTGSVLYPMAVHILFNVFNLLTQRYYTLLTTSDRFFPLFFLATLSALLLLFVLFRLAAGICRSGVPFRDGVGEGGSFPVFRIFTIPMIGAILLYLLLSLV